MSDRKSVNKLSMAKDPFFSRARSIREIAAYIDSSEEFVEEKIHAGELRARKLSPRFIRVLPADLLAWLERGSTTDEILRRAYQKSKKPAPPDADQ
jgi:excisionase family DNA binding protein